MKCVLVALALLCLMPPAARGEGVEAGTVETSTGVICNTRQQIERFIAINDSDPVAAIAAVNAEHGDPSACAVASLAFLRSREAVTVRKADAAFQIVRILVV